MNSNPVNLKLTQVSLPLKGASLDLVCLKKLFLALKTLNNEAIELEIAGLIIGPADTAAAVEEYKKSIRENFVLRVQIYGFGGELHFSEDGSILDETKMPDNVRTIVFENLTLFQVNFKYNPRNHFRVEFDFQKNDTLDLVTLPSYATTNASSVQFYASNESWGSGIQKKVLDMIQERKNGRDWLHARNIYDLFLFLLFAPLSFWVLLKLEANNFFVIFSHSRALTLAAYLYVFVLSLTVFRMIFNYSRWIFPKFELNTSTNKGSVGHRWVLGALSLSILASFLWDVIKLLFWPS